MNVACVAGFGISIIKDKIPIINLPCTRLELYPSGAPTPNTDLARFIVQFNIMQLTPGS